ncbi:unnamed protein product [Calypogeia fissa]
MRTSLAPEVGAVRDIFTGGMPRSRRAGFCCYSSVTFLNVVAVCPVFPRNRRLGTLPSTCYRYECRKCGFACESRKRDLCPIHCRYLDSPHRHRASRVPLASSTFPITQSPGSEALVTDKWRLEDEILELRGLQSQLQACKNRNEKIAVLDSNKRVRGVFGGVGRPRVFVKPSVGLASYSLDEFDVYILKCLVAIGQEHLLEWPRGLGDVYAVQEKANPRPIFKSPASSVKGAFTRLGKVIENLEEPQGKFWQSMPALVMPWSETSHHHSNEASRLANEVCCDDAEARLLESLQVLIGVLGRLEKFYDSIGGIIGYQVRALELMRESEAQNNQGGFSVNGDKSSPSLPRRQFSVPFGPDLSRDKAYATQAASWGLEGLPEMGEIYPLGGAGDRLGLVDESTGESLPVAMLPYCGRSLLEGLIRDLQAREYLHFNVFGAQHITPVAIMTSSAKRNDQRVHALCDHHGWFGRGKGNFRLFEQPLVPTVAAADGQWLLTKPLKTVLKPGGHGVIWKLANDEGIFKWFYSKERRAAIVRQISNPLAGTDCTLLALSGIGLKHNKKLGFASCERNVGTAEGVNVLMEKRLGDGSHEYAVTCIEYTEFNKLGILDVPITPGSMQAQYPANTNVLFVDLASVEHVASSQTSASLPGMIMNLKKPVEYVDQWGNKRCVRAGRLECTMQNVADSLVNKHFSRLSSSDQGQLDTFLLYNQRRKVTSSAKRQRKDGEHSLHQTPDGSFLDLTRNASDLLSYCGVLMPQMEGNQCYVEYGPPFLVFFHPSLGPLWDVIRQKIKGGSLASGSELQLEVAEFSWENVQLDGSLLIHATNVMGSVEDKENKESILRYGFRCGRCRLSNVKVKNQGIDWGCKRNTYWQNKIQRFESLEVFLEEDAEFEAHNVTIEGPHKFFVPKGHRMNVTSAVSGELISKMEVLPRGMATGYGSWAWVYNLKQNGEVVLTMVNQ